MTIRFAAANPQYNPFVTRLMGTPIRLRAANDNVLGLCSDKLLKAALRHFAEHGLGAAGNARMRAEQAFRSGEDASGRWWLSICRSLDRRMADTLARRLDVAREEDSTPRRRVAPRDN